MTKTHQRQEINLDLQVATRLLWPDTPALAAEVASEHPTRRAAHAAPEAAS
jgi:hypothetical protein